MIDQLTLITYALIVLGFVFIPGPATLLTVMRASTSGTKVGIATGAGITVGDLFHTAIAAIGISAIIAASAMLFNIIKFIGAAYLIYLGIIAFIEKAPTLGTPQTVKAITTTVAFKQAVLVEILNPKTALFFLAFLPQFVDPSKGPLFTQFAILGLVFALIGFFSTIVFATSAGTISSLLTTNKTISRFQNKVVGSIYCGLGLRVAFQER